MYEQVQKAKNIRTIFNPDILPYEEAQQVHKTHKAQDAQKKILLTQGEQSLQQQKILQNQGFQVRLLPKAYPIHADIMITEDKVYFVSFGTTITALEIKHPIFVASQTSLFDIARTHAS